MDCARDVAGCVEENVFVALDDAGARRVEIRLEPLGRDEDFGCAYWNGSLIG